MPYDNLAWGGPIPSTLIAILREPAFKFRDGNEASRAGFSTPDLACCEEFIELASRKTDDLCGLFRPDAKAREVLGIRDC